MKTDPGTCHFYKRKKLEYNKEIESLKAQLESNEVGCLSDKLLPNGWKVRRVQGEGKIYFLSPQMDIFKSNKAVLDFINSHSEMFSQEDIKKIQSFIKERQKIRKEGIREMKEINKKKNEELIKMMKNLNKKYKEGGEERVSILF